MGSKRRRRGTWLLAGLTLLAGCNRQDAERLAKISRKGLAGAEALLAGPTGGLPGSLSPMRSMGLESRVSTRLRWEKGLVDAAIEVRAQGGAVELRGKVQNLTQQRRAVEIAETTAGVEKVTDQLRIEPP